MKRCTSKRRTGCDRAVERRRFGTGRSASVSWGYVVDIGLAGMGR